MWLVLMSEQDIIILEILSGDLDDPDIFVLHLLTLR